LEIVVPHFLRRDVLVMLKIGEKKKKQ
jgi:hypothetical protein